MEDEPRPRGLSNADALFLIEDRLRRDALWAKYPKEERRRYMAMYARLKAGKRLYRYRRLWAR